MMHHDQSKIIQNEFIYHPDGRYMDEGMMDELMIQCHEPLSELNHLENGMNKTPMINSSSNYMINEDYFNTFSYNTAQTNQYSFHQLQPANSTINGLSQANQPQYNHHHQYIQSTNNTTPNTAYLMNNQTPNNGSGGGGYVPKLITRTPSFNSSSASSPSSSSLSSSSMSLNNIPQVVNTSTNNFNLSNEFDTSTNNTSGSTIAPNPNDPAELVRQKQLRGQKLTPDEIQLLVKDRQRKDNHNMIERRRRFNINDRIKELGQLLPKNGEYDTKQNKGSILKASVEYITQIKIEVEELKKGQETNKNLHNLNKRLWNRIKELEMICMSHGIDVMNSTNTIQNQNNFILNSSPNKNDQSPDNLNQLIHLNYSLNEENLNTLPSTSTSQQDNFYQTYNSSNQQQQQPQTKQPAKKTKAQSKKRAHSDDSVKTKPEDIKIPKQEPISPTTNISKVNQMAINPSEISSPSVSSSTSALVKLMTPNSKDPTLTSSSVSSPPSPASSSTPSSTSKSPPPSAVSIPSTNNSIIPISCMVTPNDCYN